MDIFFRVFNSSCILADCIDLESGVEINKEFLEKVIIYKYNDK